ncbi:HD family phosphohydrolase [Salirhabdus salicampi]|uniref:HD family phosphohydrolase n=1 Tax=Salirhabdus salicampi TaxID=476102 RepID=UPI0020C59948|nr:HDIG domain-containing metalloprotein [Salirhabdus salicampi]MCP8616899.1 HDIG domain-containing protein [Salirhabdus salicampi]
MRKFTSYFTKRHSLFYVTVSVMLFAIFFYMMAVTNVHPRTYELERFSTASETIYSPVTVEDKKETESRVREAIQSVEEQYTIFPDISEERLAVIHELFDAAQQTIANGYSEEDGNAAVEHFKQMLSMELMNEINDENLLAILQLSEEERERGKGYLLDEVPVFLEQGIRTEELHQKRKAFKDNIRFTDLSERTKDVIANIHHLFIVENTFFDAEKTSDERKKAARNVEPVMIRAGDVIVEKNDVITNEIYEDLVLVGLIKDEFTFLPYVGLALLAMLLAAIFFIEWVRLNKWDYKSASTILIISIGMVSLMKIFSSFDTFDRSFYLAVPVAAGAMLIKWVTNERFAIVLAVIYAVIGSVLFNYEMPGYLNIDAAIYFLFSQLAGIYFFKSGKDRIEIIQVGLGILFINVMTLLLFLLLPLEQISVIDSLLLAGYGFSSAFLSMVLTLGLLPFLEAGLGIISESKLLALSNPNHPLLRKILVESPGTYHHSLMVANLSEAACEAIGANGLLARVAAYYHDIGKTIKPGYFIENQMGRENPHDFMLPDESANIIIQHPYHGAKLLKEYKLPKEIIDICEQHHGTTLLKYFYYKAKEKNENISEQNYRYPGPKPKTKEAAIVCLCDSVEAAVRSLKEPSMEKIEEIVKSIIHDRLVDGQLNDCPLTINNLTKIEKAICEMLKGIFHSRIEYPKPPTNGMKEAN